MHKDADSSSIERGVLGGMLLDGVRTVGIFSRAGGCAEWFTSNVAKQTAKVILSLYARGHAIDVLTVSTEDSGIPLQWLTSCTDTTVVSAHAAFYVEQLRGIVARRRSIAALSNGMRRMEHAASEDTSTCIADIAESLYSVARGHTDEPVTIGEAAEAMIRRWTDHRRRADLLPWPIERISRVMGHVEDELIWLISQPSVGKTAFALQWSTELALAGHSVSFASLESSRDRVSARLVSYLGQVNTLQLRRGNSNSDNIESAQKAADTLKSIPLHVTDRGMTLEQLYCWGRSEVQGGARFLVVDNTRHIRRDVSSFSRVEWMGEISARLKQLRDDTGTPILVLHHASRPNEQGKDGVSWSSDIRRDADCLFFLREDEERTEPHTGPDNPGRFCVTFDVEKNRDGLSEVSVPLQFIKWRQSFVEWEKPISSPQWVS